MSNKKRISKKITEINQKKYLKLFSLACKLAIKIINHTLEERRKHSIALEKYTKGGFIPNDGNDEMITGSKGQEMILPKFEIKRT